MYAYDVGGESAVGLIFLARLIPAALIAPFAGMLGDRYPRERVLLFTNLTRIVLVSAAAVAVFADAVLVARLRTVNSRDDRYDSVPVFPGGANAELWLERRRNSPPQTPSPAASKVSRGFAGPALAGILLAVASTGAVFLITALLIVVSAGFLTLIRIERSERPHRELDASTIAAERIAGFTTLGRQPALRVMVMLLGAQTAIIGAVQVFIVVVAIQQLDIGDGGVGYLNAAMGVGAFIGAVGALSLTGARRLSPTFLFGIILIGLPLVLLGLRQSVIVAVFVFALMGIGSALVDVAGLTLVQRAVPEDVLARVFGVIQMIFYATLRDRRRAGSCPHLLAGRGDRPHRGWRVPSASRRALRQDGLSHRRGGRRSRRR